MEQGVYQFIKSEESSWKTVRVPLTDSKDWNMYEHIQRCTNVANGWFHSGKNDGNRPYDDIVTPIINVAFRTEGFDVKDIVPFVDDAVKNYKSFLVKKYHPKWARTNQLDTLIDEVVESSIIYDLVILKNVGGIRPEVQKLQTIAFCDQTDALSGPICFKHSYSIPDILDYKGKWWDDKIDLAVLKAKPSKNAPLSTGKEVKTPGKYIEVYELHGRLPESWLPNGGDPFKYVDQIHIACFYLDENGDEQGLTLYAGKEKPISQIFEQLKIDQVKSYGRACGRSLVETLFEPQVWKNYSEIKIKNMLDSAVDVIVTDSDDYGNQKLAKITPNTIVKINKGDRFDKINTQMQNLADFQNYGVRKENSARVIGSASDAQLGTNPVSGTPFALQSLVVQQGQGIHEYRQGKIATWFADTLYPKWILGYLVKDMNNGKSFSEELSLDELQWVTERMINNRTELKAADLIFEGKIVTPEAKKQILEFYKTEFAKMGTRGFFEVVKEELKGVKTDVFVNIKGKQRLMAQNADKLTNVIRALIANPAAYAQPGISDMVNQLFEESGMNPVSLGKLQAQPQLSTQTNGNPSQVAA